MPASLQKKVIVSIVTSVIALSLIIVVFSGQRSSTNPNSNKNQGNVTLPIIERKFYMGLVPTPKSYPNTTFADIIDAYREIGEIAEIANGLVILTGHRST